MRERARSRVRASAAGRPPATVLIVLEKAAGAVVAAAGGAAALFLHTRSGVAHALWLGSGGPPDSLGDVLVARVVRWVTHTLNARPEFAVLAGTVLLVWALLLAVEAVGFWYGRVWAELLIVLETAALLPIEVWDLVRTHRPGGLLTMAVNVLILLYVGSRYRRRTGAASPARPPAGESANAADRRQPQTGTEQPRLGG